MIMKNFYLIQLNTAKKLSNNKQKRMKWETSVALLRLQVIHIIQLISRFVVKFVVIY